MCGRYAASANPDELIEMFDVDEAEDVPAPSYNVAPTDLVPAVLERAGRADADQRDRDQRDRDQRDRDQRDREQGDREQGERGVQDAAPAGVVRRLRPLRWGLVPSWSKGPGKGAPMINARVETVASKPAFRRAFSTRRCLLPADGYFEWYELNGVSASPSRAGAKGKPRKQPFFIHRADGTPLVMAGIYEFWKDPDPAPDTDPWLLTCSVITTTATDALGHIHDRMPMVIGRDRWAAWLDPRRTDPAEALDLLAVTEADQLEAYAVSPAVGSVRNNSPDLVRPLQVEPDSEQ